jgi:hypothetical protein
VLPAGVGTTPVDAPASAKDAANLLRLLSDAAHLAGELAELSAGFADVAAGFADLMRDAGEVDLVRYGDPKYLPPALKRGPTEQDAAGDPDRTAHRRHPNSGD